MRMNKNLRTLSAIIIVCSALPAGAASVAHSVSAGWENFSNNVATTWQQPDGIDFYLPAITWHNRATYDREHIDKYNERPWGAGGGISRYDQKGNWHGLYVMTFRDSFNQWEPFGGYGWLATWRPLSDEKFHWGAGYTAGVTARHNWQYIPLPAILPLASVGYGKLDFQMTYIPGTHNNGNVYFAWLRYHF